MKYKVVVREVNVYEFEVEAKSEYEAEIIAGRNYVDKQPDDMYVSDINVEPTIDVNCLTKEQLWKLRQEITLGSIYINDYVNSFGIPAKNCCAFFDSFLEDCWYLADYEDRNIKDIEGIYAAYDDADHLFNYYYGIENPFGNIE